MNESGIDFIYFYAKQLGWFTFKIPFLGPEPTVTGDSNFCSIAYDGDAGGRGGNSFTTLSISVIIGSNELTENIVLTDQNPNGIRYVRVLKSKLHQGVVFDLGKLVTLSMNENRIGLSYSDTFFSTAIHTLRSCLPEEERAKEIVQAHIEKRVIFGSIIETKPHDTHWLVVTKQFGNLTNYIVDILGRIIIRSEFRRIES